MITVTELSDIKLLLEILFGKGYIYRYQCAKCGVGSDDYKFFDPHHVTYKPAYVVKVCHRCHIRATHLNSRRARELKRKLNNRDRWKVWREFLKEKTSSSDYEESKQKMKDWFD